MQKDQQDDTRGQHAKGNKEMAVCDDRLGLVEEVHLYIPKSTLHRPIATGHDVNGYCGPS